MKGNDGDGAVAAVMKGRTVEKRGSGRDDCDAQFETGRGMG